VPVDAPFPIRCVAREVQLVEEDADGVFGVRCTFPLR